MTKEINKENAKWGDQESSYAELNLGQNTSQHSQDLSDSDDSYSDENFQISFYNPELNQANLEKHSLLPNNTTNRNSETEKWVTIHQNYPHEYEAENTDGANY